MSNVVGGHFLDLARADDCSENGGWAGLRGDDGRNGQRLDQGHRGLHACSGCRDSPPSKEAW